MLPTIGELRATSACKALLLTGAVLLAGCGGAAAPSQMRTSNAPAPTPTMPHSPQATASEGPTRAPADELAFKGKGNMTSAVVELGGDYTLSATVAAQAGCRWSLSVLGGDQLVSISTDAAGAQSQELSETFDPASYQLVVRSSKCGSWAVRLAR